MSSHNQEADLCFKQGLLLLHSDKNDEAIDFFTKAISLDPNFAEAYNIRGDLLIRAGRIIEGNTDQRKAKDLRSGKIKDRRKTRKIVKYNLQEAESIYDNVFPEETDPAPGETVDLDNQIYDYVFSDESPKTEKQWDGLIEESSKETTSPAILEFVGGRREEVFRAQLFQPTPCEITILQADAENSKRIVLLRELCCIRLARLPSDCEQVMDASCPIEIIETMDGNIYHLSINPQQCLEGGLLGFSTKENDLFPYAFFPEDNIKLRYQERHLGEILLAKRFITDDILNNALAEHQMLRTMPIGKIIARQANILQSTVEDAITNAHKSGLQGLKTGEILLDAGLVSEEQIMDALDFQEQMRGKKLGEFLIEKGIIKEKELFISLAEKFRIPFIDLRQQKISKKILGLLPRELVLRFKVLPIALNDSTLVVATASLDLSELRDAILRDSRLKNVEFALVQPTHLKNVINILYQDQRNHGDDA